jgi:hypothetical protein
MMPAEPRVGADQQLSFERLKRVDLEDRAVGNLAERRRMPRSQDDEGGDTDPDQSERKDRSKRRAIKRAKRHQWSPKPLLRGDTNPLAVRLFIRVVLGIEKP